MRPERRHRIEAVFEAALDRPAEGRHEWLREECGADDALRAAVLRLLDAHDRAEGILDGPPPAIPSSGVPEEVQAAGRRIGAYRLVREIGRGGMSIVYLAERDDQQYRQSVAVKLIRRGLDSPDLVERFRAERQILASLSHPHIARLLDGGTTEDGLPFLAMEHVAGEPVTAYCDRRDLTLAERLKLFVTIARTVQYAHRNLVVHRDLKPSNILVTDEGEIKLLDFGIAKLLDPTATPDGAPQTRPGFRPMTPEFASPEQIGGGAVTTATDVYGLGRVLDELLSVPRRRQDRRGPWRRRRGGDLDRIVSVATHEEPERRYASAEQLAEDVEHFLDRKAIRARGDSVPYRVGRLAARHRWGVAAAAVFVLLLAAYAATVTFKEREVRAALEHASLEAERAEQVTSFLMRLFEASDPAGVASDAITARELLERGAARAEQFSHQPAAQAQMLDVIARTYQHLGQYDRALPVLERALDLRGALFGDSHPLVAESVYHLARLQHDRGQLDSAEVLFRRALHVQQRQGSAEPAREARMLHGLSQVLRDRGDYRRAAQLARTALDRRRDVLGSEHSEVAESLHDLAEILRREGRYEAAEPLYAEALALRQRLFGDQHPAVAENLHNLAYLRQLRGDVASVEPLYHRALAIYRTLFGDEHPAIAATTSNLGLLMFRTGDLQAADSLHRAALTMRRHILGPEHPAVAQSLALLAAVQRPMGELELAEALYRESLAIQRRVLGNQHPDMAHAMNGLALVLRDQGDYQAADSLYEEVLAMRLSLLGDAHPAIATTINDRGVLMREWGRYPAAESLLLAALQMRHDLLGDAHPHVERSRQNLVTLYETWKGAPTPTPLLHPPPHP